MCVHMCEHVHLYTSAGVASVEGVARARDDERVHHYTICHTPFTIHHTPYTIRHTLCTIHYIPYAILYSVYTIHHAPYIIHRLT